MKKTKEQIALDNAIDGLIEEYWDEAHSSMYEIMKGLFQLWKRTVDEEDFCRCLNECRGFGVTDSKPNNGKSIELYGSINIFDFIVDIPRNWKKFNDFGTAEVYFELGRVRDHSRVVKSSPILETIDDSENVYIDVTPKDKFKMVTDPTLKYLPGDFEIDAGHYEDDKLKV